MFSEGESVEFRGAALNGAVQVSVDEGGRVRSVRLNPQVTRRLWPEQLGEGVVTAHAEARAAALNGGRST
jgi:DNA-binding protein YbaB